MKKVCFLLLGLSFCLTTVFAQLTDCNSPEITKWEKSIKNFEHLDSVESYTEDAILFTGSSSIRLWNTIKEDMAPYEVIQRGYGGAKLSDYSCFTDRIVASHKIRGIVIFIGNDISNSEQASAEKVDSLFKNVYSKIRAIHPDVPVFWIHVTPTPSRWKVWDKTVEANMLIKKFCDSEENLFFIDTTNEFIKEGEARPELFRNDMLHLNEEGYDLWASIIKNSLKNAGINP